MRFRFLDSASVPTKSAFCALLLGIPLFLAGCSSWTLETVAAPAMKPGAPGPAELAKVCVVRTSVLASAVTFPTHDNGVLVGATRGTGHFCYLAAPGEHEIVIEADEPERAKLSVVAGKTYYLKQEVNNIFGYVTCSAAWVDASVAIDLFEKTDYQVLTSVPGSERLPGDPPFAPAR